MEHNSTNITKHITIASFAGSNDKCNFAGIVHAVQGQKRNVNHARALTLKPEIKLSTIMAICKL